MLDCSKIDELMMDWLYQELDESSSARVAEHVQGCARCTAEASALQRTRAAFQELSPVDPPVALSAILLHEAARRAPAVAATAGPRLGDEGGFWARVRAFFRPIALHPAAAAVAMLVLVAGVAGTLYVRHGDEMTDTADLKNASPATASDSTLADGKIEQQPSSVDMPVAPEAQPATATPAPPADEADGDVRSNRDGYTADLLGKEDQAELSRKVAKERLESAGQDTSKQFSIEKKPPATRSKKSSKPVEPKGPIANAVSGADPLVEGEMDLRAGIGGGGGATRGRADDKMQKAAQPPPAPPSTTASTSNPSPSPKQEAQAPGAIDFADPGAGDTGYRVYKDKPMSATELRANEGKLGVAVKKKDCVTAARIANDILDRNPAYYTKKVASQAKPCQWYVSNESRNRSARRAASKNVGSGKNVAAPQKAKAAPQKDQAAESAE